MSKFKSELKVLATCQPSTARILFERAPQEFIRAIIDAAWTTLTGKLNLSQKDIDDIRVRGYQNQYGDSPLTTVFFQKIR